MNRWLISCGLVCLTPALIEAQTAKIQAEIDTELAQARAYEDIEIMRRLLQRKLAGFAQSCRQCHQPSSAAQALILYDRAASMPIGRDDVRTSNSDAGSIGRYVSGDFSLLHHGVHAAASESIPVDGHYLKGTGIVMQAQLPASLLQFLPASPAPKKQPLPASEWDLIRKQLRGEKVEASSVVDDFHGRIPEGANLQDVLVKILAEHGKHFQSLADNERLMLTVTFRPQKDAPSGAMSGGAIGDMGGGGGSAMSNTESAMAGGMMAAGVPQVGPRSSSKDYELLADFRMRQGNYADAAKTLEKAIELNTDSARAAGLYRKLASALLLQSPSNQQTLDRANDLLRKAMGIKPPPAPALKTPLPTRLIISASRSALEKASAGSLDDFRKQITITWLRFDHPVLRHPTASPEGSERGDEGTTK
jgi:tetratricopeptide (TPR) repeat protein